jgi:hypothetical protein
MPAGLAQQDNENLQTSQVLETCEVSATGIFYGDLAACFYAANLATRLRFVLFRLA